VIESKGPLKKRTGNEPENKADHVAENKGTLKNEPETDRRFFTAILPSSSLPH